VLRRGGCCELNSYFGFLEWKRPSTLRAPKSPISASNAAVIQSFCGSHVERFDFYNVTIFQLEVIAEFQVRCSSTIVFGWCPRPSSLASVRRMNARFPNIEQGTMFTETLPPYFQNSQLPPNLSFSPGAGTIFRDAPSPHEKTPFRTIGLFSFHDLFLKPSPQNSRKFFCPSIQSPAI
jgi:hypothetical protein